MTVMNDLPRQKLCEIVSQQGRSISDQPQRCKGFLLDFCGEYRREISALISAVQEGIPQTLLSSKGVPATILVDRLTRQLQTNLALDEMAARWAVESWGLALGVISQPTQLQQTGQTTTYPAPSSVFPTAVTSQPVAAASPAAVSTAAPSVVPSVIPAAVPAAAPAARPPAPYPPLSQPPLSSSPAPASFPQPVASVSGTIPSDRSQNWLQAIALGSVVGMLMIGGFISARPFLSSIASSPEPETPTSPINSPSPPKPSPSPFTPPSPAPAPPRPPAPISPIVTIPPSPIPKTPASITQREAVALVNAWLEAKQEIFASPYSYQSVRELTTGPLYADLTKADGPVAWLKNNGAYYRFGVQRIESVETLDSEGNKASIEVWVTEERTLYKKDGSIDPNQSDLATRLVRYSLERVEGEWKIADYRTQKTR